MTNEEILCEVTENHLNTGLRGIPVGTCKTSFVTPNEGVHYCGYPIRELVDFPPEDIIYLLFNKELPNPEQSTKFKSELSARASVPSGLETVYANLPKTGHPMDWLSVGIHTLGMYDTTGNWMDDALNLVARMPRLMGLIYRYREGREANIPNDDTSKSLVERFVDTLDLPNVNKEKNDKGCFYLSCITHGSWRW